jgi:hypothetical protein
MIPVGMIDFLVKTGSSKEVWGSQKNDKLKAWVFLAAKKKPHA